LAVMIVASWTLLGIVLPRFPVRSKLKVLAQSVCAGAAAFGVFVALNPLLWTHPPGALPPDLESLAAKSLLGRTKAVIAFRGSVFDGASKTFPDDALASPVAKAAVVAVQGFGRFGPLGIRRLVSQPRYDWGMDCGALVWGPLVVSGALILLGRGRRELAAGEPPVAWAIVAQWAVALLTVTAFIPLAWDRYMLPIQAVSALLAATAIVAVFDKATALAFPSREGASLP
jgi:hypothetical protein